MIISKGVYTEHVRNLVDSCLYFHDFGVTVTSINGKEYPTNPDAFEQALIEPAFLFKRTGGGVELTVVAEAANLFSIHVELPFKGPWTSKASKEKIRVILALDQRTTGEGFELLNPNADALVRVDGLPTNEEFIERIGRHEEVHVQDVIRQVTSILIPWDAAIANFKNNGGKITATSRDFAKNQFYASVGGTPREIMRKLVEAFRSDGSAFHHKTEGGSPWIRKYKASKDDIQIYYDMPMV